MDNGHEMRDFLVSRRAKRSPRSRFDRDLTVLIGELAARSSEFGARWARHNVRLHRAAVKRLHSKLVDDIELTGDLEIFGENLTLTAYTAKPDSHAQQQLNFLASWPAPPDDRAASPGPTRVRS
jgi:hypothetical protein